MLLSYNTIPTRALLPRNQKLRLAVECWSTSVVNIAQALFSLPLCFHFLLYNENEMSIAVFIKMLLIQIIRPSGAAV